MYHLRVTGKLTHGTAIASANFYLSVQHECTLTTIDSKGGISNFHYDIA